MSVSRNRHPQDLVEFYKMLEQRISKLESSNRSNNTSVDSGSFALNGGRLVVNDSLGNIIFELKQEDDIPVVYMYPTYGNPEAAKLKISGSSTIDQGPEFRVEVLQEDGTPNGGYLSVSQGSVALSQTIPEGVESGITFSHREDRQRAITLRGKFWPNETMDANQATFVGRINVDAGFSALTVSYDRQMSDVMLPVPALLNSTGVVAWGLTSQTDVDFTVAWAGTDAKTINYWCFAIPVGL